MAFLKKVGRTSQNKKYADLPIDGPEVVIGRDNECDVRISNIEMSRRHARLIQANDKWQMTDLKSTNGVFINNEKLKAMVPRFLNEGDTVAFGPPEKTEFVYKFHIKREEKSNTKSETKRIKLLERQIEEQSKSQELLQKRLKQQENETKRKQAEIERLTEQLKKEESEKQKLKETGERQKKALKEMKKKSKGDKQSVKCENRESSVNLQVNSSFNKLEQCVNEGASTSGLQVKRKFEDIFDSELTCPICSELFIQPVHISCSHTFCTYCIELWKKNPNSHRECPICRKPMKHMIREIVIENLIDKIVGEMDNEDKKRRLSVVEDRKKKLEELLSESSTSRIEDDSFDSDMESSTNYSDEQPSFASNFFAALYNSSLMDASQDSNNSDFGEMDFSHEEEDDYEFSHDGEDENEDLEEEYWEEDDDMTPSEVDGYETANSYLIENVSVLGDDTEFESSSDESVTDSSDSSNEL